MSDARETVLVTGASSGIGRDLAALFAAERSEIILTARREELLRELAAELEQRYGVTAHVIVADLADPAGAAALEARVTALGRRVDVLVNNAGFGLRGDFSDLPLEGQMQLLQVNVASLTRLARTFLPGMLERGRGGILNVGSLAGFVPGPRMAVYYASKAYVLALSEALAEEARGSGVTITCLAPGPTETGFADVANMHTARLFRFGGVSSRGVARAGHRAFRRGRTLATPGLPVKLTTLLLRLGPRALNRRVTHWLHR
jgi:uncharacterized protein